MELVPDAEQAKFFALGAQFVIVQDLCQQDLRFKVMLCCLILETIFEAVYTSRLFEGSEKGFYVELILWVVDCSTVQHVDFSVVSLAASLDIYYKAFYDLTGSSGRAGLAAVVLQQWSEVISLESSSGGNFVSIVISLCD